VNPLPFYIICFNRTKGLKYAVDFARRSTIEIKPIIMDMGSTSPEFMNYRDSLGLKTHYFIKGVGPRDLFTNGTLKNLGAGGFYLADGDLDYSSVPSDAFLRVKELSEDLPWFPKIGLGLQIHDLPDDVEGNRVREWAKMDWATNLSPDIYFSGLDTTFAYYPRRSAQFYYRPALRLAGDYEVRHYPWYERIENFDEEASFYYSQAKASISSTQDALHRTPSTKIKQLILQFCFKAFAPFIRYRVTGPFLVRVLSFRGTIPAADS
jgi:hypothetical protein